jgi:hypothetical protein
MNNLLHSLCDKNLPNTSKSLPRKIALRNLGIFKNKANSTNKLPKFKQIPCEYSKSELTSPKINTTLNNFRHIRNKSAQLFNDPLFSPFRFLTNSQIIQEFTEKKKKNPLTTTLIDLKIDIDINVKQTGYFSKFYLKSIGSSHSNKIRNLKKIKMLKILPKSSNLLNKETIPNEQNRPVSQAIKLPVFTKILISEQTLETEIAYKEKEMNPKKLIKKKMFIKS